jgi:hypothetical protein
MDKFYEKTEDNMTLFEKIEDIIKEEHSYLTTDKVIEKIFDKYNINLDEIRNIIQNINDTNKKCEVCEYNIDYFYDYKSKTKKLTKKFMLKCKICDNVNTCQSCYDIYYYENINVSACKVCKYYKCTCECPCGCVC